MVAWPSGTGKFTWVRAIAASSRSMPLRPPKSGKPRFASPRKRGSPEHLVSPKEKSLWATTVRTMLSVARSLLTTPRLAKKFGVSGPSPAIPPNRMKRKSSRWPRKPGTVKAHGRLAAAMTAPKNGFFYILDAKTGKVLSAKPLVQTTWASAYDVQTQKPILIPASQGGGRQWTVHNWWPMSYDTLTGLVYIPTTDHRPDTKAPAEAGEGGEGLFGRLVAWDPIAEAARWSAEEAISVNGGVLSTAGNLVFQGQGTGEFAAYAADTGKKLRSIQTKSAIDSKIGRA